jgi:hypothetical protein
MNNVTEIVALLQQAEREFAGPGPGRSGGATPSMASPPSSAHYASLSCFAKDRPAHMCCRSPRCCSPMADRSVGSTRLPISSKRHPTSPGRAGVATEFEWESTTADAASVRDATAFVSH